MGRHIYNSYSKIWALLLWWRLIPGCIGFLWTALIFYFTYRCLLSHRKCTARTWNHPRGRALLTVTRNQLWPPQRCQSPGACPHQPLKLVASVPVSSTQTCVTVTAAVTQPAASKWPCSPAAHSSLLVAVSSCAAGMLHLTLQASQTVSTISILHSAEDQVCLRDPHQRLPILFGVDFVSGCTLRIEEGANCSLGLENVLGVFSGSDYPQDVAFFGNSPLDAVLDWLPIRSNLNPGEIQSCSILVSFHLEIQWTKYGLLVNPQAQLVGIQEIIQFANSSLAFLSGGSNILKISVSVAFVAASADASPGYRAKPTVNATLPSDFFYPFV